MIQEHKSFRSIWKFQFKFSLSAKARPVFQREMIVVVSWVLLFATFMYVCISEEVFAMFFNAVFWEVSRKTLHIAPLSQKEIVPPYHIWFYMQTSGVYLYIIFIAVYICKYYFIIWMSFHICNQFHKPYSECSINT